MIRNITRNSLLSLLITLTVMSSVTIAQRPFRPTDRQVEALLLRIENRAENFRSTVTQTLNNGRYNGTSRADEVDRLITNFTASAQQVRTQLRNPNRVSGAVQSLLEQSRSIDTFIQTNRFNNDRNWIALKTDLATLAKYYDVPWQWDNGTYNAANNSTNTTNNSYYNRRLTGTYTLDSARTDDTQTAIDRATRGLDAQEAERVRNSLLRRLEAPAQLSLEQNGNRITIASSAAPQATLEADGRVQTETRPNGRVVRTSSSLSGNILTIDSNGDRGNDYRVTFEALNNGRRLLVTRRFDMERLTQPVTVQSYYNRTSETAQWNIYNDRGYNNRGYNDRDTNSTRETSTTTRNGRFVVPNETALTATLNNDLNTKDARDGDRFTLNVTTPGPYRGAVIEGQIVKADRSGRISGRAELGLNFERIQMPDGRSYEFSGYIEGVRNANGEKVTIDNEGSVKDDNSQTQRTVTRSGIGAAIGAIIGGIAGGGKGAGIGAVLGAGAGAGSVVVQGRDDLMLMRGSEFSIRASAPRSAS